MPELPEGPLRELVRELHDLHARAGWPGTRRIADGRDFSHTAVHELFTKTATPPRLPLLLAVVETLCSLAPRVETESTLDKFDRMWVATIAADRRPDAHGDEIAGLWYSHPRRKKGRPRLGGPISIERPVPGPESIRMATALRSMLGRCNLSEDEVVARSAEVASATRLASGSQSRVKPLGPAELRQILTGRRLPTQASLRTILLVCNIPESRVEAFVSEVVDILPAYLAVISSVDAFCGNAQRVSTFQPDVLAGYSPVSGTSASTDIALPCGDGLRLRRSNTSRRLAERATESGWKWLCATNAEEGLGRRSFLMRCCVRDEGWPFGIALRAGFQNSAAALTCGFRRRVRTR